jgi:hypothetical protein
MQDDQMKNLDSILENNNIPSETIEEIIQEMNKQKKAQPIPVDKSIKEESVERLRDMLILEEDVVKRAKIAARICSLNLDVE